MGGEAPPMSSSSGGDSLMRELARELTGPAPPAAVGRYVFDKLLGSGGNGLVYRAFDPALQRHIAIKVLRHADPKTAQRFLREARAQARREHENVCKVYEVSEEGAPYIPKQYIEGVPLGEAAAALTL